METVRFDEAWERAKRLAATRLRPWASHLVLVRDLQGKIRFVLDDRTQRAPEIQQDRGQLAADIHSRLGAFSPGPNAVLLFASEMLVPEAVLDSADCLTASVEGVEIRLLERLLIGSEWLPDVSTRPAPRSHRLTLFGIKGGVGRSTAGAVLAQRLARAGRRVLVFDLDLESPGVGTTLLPPEAAPDYGLVDWLVEDAVGQGDEELLRDLVASSPLAREGGEILVVPAAGRERQDYEYLPKLARAYLDRPNEAGVVTTFGGRLRTIVAALEGAKEPDVVLLDSRAGLHDIAATAVTGLDALSLLFAVDTAQTWQAYRWLFGTWREHPSRVSHFRNNLQIVGALMPETDTQEYFEGLLSRSYDLFLENLYVEAGPGEESEFNFDLQDTEAPHYPLRIHWSRSLQQYDPARDPRALTEQQIDAAFGDFVLELERRLVRGDGR